MMTGRPYLTIGPDSVEKHNLSSEVVYFPLTGGTIKQSKFYCHYLKNARKWSLQQYFHVFLAYAMKGSREICVE